MANDPHSVDFVASMRQLLGMDKEKVTALLDKLDADELDELSDAISNQDKTAAERAIGQVDADEAVNKLFRGSNLADLDQDQRRSHRSHAAGQDQQFAIGDDVSVRMQDADGKVHNVTATVERADGPEGSNTLLVRIKGKSVVIDKKDVMIEAVLGMVGLPNLNRMQQLAGIQMSDMMPSSASPLESVGVEEQPDEVACDGPLERVMGALDALEAALPEITLGDLKAVRARICAVQMSLNESLDPAGRPRKH